MNSTIENACNQARHSQSHAAHQQQVAFEEGAVTVRLTPAQLDDRARREQCQRSAARASAAHQNAPIVVTLCEAEHGLTAQQVAAILVFVAQLSGARLATMLALDDGGLFHISHAMH